MKLLSSILLLLSAHFALGVEPLLREGDVFHLVIDGPLRKYVTDFELDYVVDNGTVTFPILGRIPAANLTPEQLGAVLTKRLIEGKIFTNPKVTIKLQPKKAALHMGGGVRNPGPQHWTAGMTLSQSIAGAAGAGWNDKVRLVRDGKSIPFSLKAIKKNPALDPKVLPGDIIDVDGEF